MRAVPAHRFRRLGRIDLFPMRLYIHKKHYLFRTSGVPSSSKNSPQISASLGYLFFLFVFLFSPFVTRNSPLLFFFAFALFSTLSFHAVRSAPSSTSSFTTASRTCVAPCLPHPPWTGRNTSGSSATNIACCSGVSIRFP